jgi:hypothetical protein
MDNKTVDFVEWKHNKVEQLKRKLLEEFLADRGLELNEENINRARFEFEVPDDLKKEMNEYLLLNFIDDNSSLVSFNVGEKKISLLFYDGNETKELFILVDVHGNLQLSSNLII